MPLRFLKRLFIGGPPPPLPSRPGVGLTELEKAAHRFADWVSDRAGRTIYIGFNALQDVDRELDRLRDDTTPSTALQESLAVDAASFVGVAARRELGGSWEEDPVFGLILRFPGGRGLVKLRALDLVQKKWELGGALSLKKFFEKLPDRLVAECALPAWNKSPDISSLDFAKRVAGKSPREAAELAADFTNQFRDAWMARFGRELPLSLSGVRELDKFLRTHYLVTAVSEEQLIGAGFFLGEVTRGLFDGEWDFREAEDATRAALVWPEIKYYPVGRIYKMITALPEGEPLDEYVRLVPAARKEMKDKQP